MRFSFAFFGVMSPREDYVNYGGKRFSWLLPPRGGLAFLPVAANLLAI